MTFDIGQAYLNADMGQDVFVYLSKEMADIVIERDPSYAKFVEPNGQILVKLDKALYGCIESAKLWYDHFARIQGKPHGSLRVQSQERRRNFHHDRRIRR